MNRVISLFIFVFIVIFFLDFSIKSLLPLADDIITYNTTQKLISGELSNADIWDKYLHEKGRNVRPLSGVYMALFVSLSGFLGSVQLLFFISSSLFITMLFLLQKYLRKFYTNTPVFYILFLVSLIIYPFSSSTLFSPMLSMVSWLWILYIFSLYLTTINKWWAIILSGFLTLLSFLTVEYFIPLLIFNFFFILHYQKKQKLLKVLVAVLLPALFFLLYRSKIAPILYPDFYDYTSERIAINFESIMNVFIGIFKTYFLDYIYVIQRAFIAIQYFQWVDYFLIVLMLSILSLLYQQKFSFKSISKKQWGLIILFNISTFAIFFVSNYKPSIFGFYNRTMGLPRIANSLLWVAAIAFVFQYFKNHLIRKVTKVLVLLFMGINTIVLIAQKNEWVYAGKYNDKLGQSLMNSVNSKDNLNILISYDNHNDSHFVTHSPTFNHNYEYLNYFDIHDQDYYKCKSINTNTYSYYCIFDIPINTFNKTTPFFKKDSFMIDDRKYSIPLYIYKYENHSLKLYKTKQEFKKEINKWK